MSFRSDIFYIAANWWWITAIIYLWSCGELTHHIEVARSLIKITSTVTGNEPEATCAAMITLIIVFGSFSTIRNAVKTTILYMVLLHLLSFQNIITNCRENWSGCIHNLYVRMIDAQQQAVHMYHDCVLQLPISRHVVELWLFVLPLLILSCMNSTCTTCKRSGLRNERPATFPSSPVNDITGLPGRPKVLEQHGVLRTSRDYSSSKNRGTQT